MIQKMTDEALLLAQILWDFNNRAHRAQDADILLVMGTNDLGVPRFARELTKQFHFPSIVVSGGVEHAKSLHGEPFGGSEAEVFRKILIDGVGDPDTIILENYARNTGDNISLTKELIEERQIKPKTGLLVHSPTMQRRALATAEKQWQNVRWRVTCEAITFLDYINGIDIPRFINILVGDSTRVLYYPTIAFQTSQSMPSHVSAALLRLIELGFDRHLPKGCSDAAAIEALLKDTA